MKSVKIGAWIALFLATGIALLYFIHFSQGTLSQKSVDWGAFGSYFGEICSCILAALNILIFYHISKLASEYSKQNLRQQLSHSTSIEYQRRINDILFDFLDLLSEYKLLLRQGADARDDGRAVERVLLKIEERLNRIKLFVRGFIREVEPFIPDRKESIDKVVEELLTTIEELKESKYADPVMMQNFFDKKAEFIRTTFDIIMRR